MTLNDKDLAELQLIINEIPYKFAVPLMVFLQRKLNETKSSIITAGDTNE